MQNFEEIIGNVFGNLTVLAYKGKTDNGHHLLSAVCTCGNEHDVFWNNLRRGKTTMCLPCAQRLRAIKATKYDVDANRYTYSSYRAMADRCLNQKQLSYPRYGGSGIEICTEWLPENNGFSAFLADMGTRPEDTTLDRIDNSKGYSKDNCRWSKVSVQNHNKGKRIDSETSEYIGVSKDGKSWRVQLMCEGNKISELYTNELEAAIAYDNHSEEIYGDRPNKTVRQEVTRRSYKRGSIVQEKKSLSWRVRLTLPDGTRKSLGSYKELSKAEEVLQAEYEKYYN